METKFNFKSQICTDKNQSERLLALGLKKETADCYYWQENDHIYGEATGVWHLETLDTEDTQEHFEYLDKYFGVCLAADEEHYFIPAWSLHRLIEMMPPDRKYEWLTISKNDVFYRCIHFGEEEFIGPNYCGDNLYDSFVIMYEWLIKKGYFPKEYLEE